jgi:hypothetical protein
VAYQLAFVVNDVTHSLSTCVGEIIGNDPHASEQYRQSSNNKPDHYSFSSCLNRLIAARLTQTTMAVAKTTQMNPNTINITESRA